MFWQLSNDTFSNGLLDVIDKVKKSYLPERKLLSPPDK